MEKGVGVVALQISAAKLDRRRVGISIFLIIGTMQHEVEYYYQYIETPKMNTNEIIYSNKKQQADLYKPWSSKQELQCLNIIYFKQW